MNTFGVCNYDDAEVKNLERYDTYEEAFSHYLGKMTSDEHYPLTWDRTLWVVWLERNKIVQLEQLETKTKCKIIEVTE